MQEIHKANRDKVTGWPNDWYVYDDGHIRGPLTALETFSMASEGQDGKKRLVSRKGYAQWYTLRDLSEIFNQTMVLNRKVERELKRLSQTSAKQAGQRLSEDRRDVSPLAHASPTARSGAHHDDAPNSWASLKLRTVKKGRLPSREPTSLSRLSEVEAKKAKSVVELSQPVRLAAIDRDFSQMVGVFPSEQASETSPKSPQKSKRRKKSALLREYIGVKTKLRLGEIRQPWISGLVGLPLSLGIYWVLWFRDLAAEVRRHRAIDTKWNVPHYVWAAIPMVHMYLIHCLAKQILEMESENRYRTTRPWVAVILALIPPLAMIYLQTAANKHWFLHVRHVMMIAKKDVQVPEV